MPVAIFRPLGYTSARLKYIRSEEHTSELQSLTNLVCRLLLEKKRRRHRRGRRAPPHSFFNDTAPTEIYTLSLHDALPIYAGGDFPSFGIYFSPAEVY